HGHQRAKAQRRRQRAKEVLDASNSALLGDEGFTGFGQRIEGQSGREGGGPETPPPELGVMGGHKGANQGQAVADQQRDEGVGGGKEDADQALGLAVGRR